MKKIKLSLLSMLAIMTLLWVVANANSLTNSHEFFAWRKILLQYSGILAIAVMSMGMLLAMRLNWVETRLNGLDKAYRLHKWLGVTTLVFTVSHWLLINVPRWLVEAGLLIKPARLPSLPEKVAIFKFFDSQRDIAEQIGEYSFYVLLVLIVIALIKRFPYRYFFMTHRWIALVYLVLILHAVVLMKYSYWSSLLGVVMAILMLLGALAALTSLFRRIGQSHKAVGEVSQVHYLDCVKVNSISIKLRSTWPKHRAGQFAFVTFDKHEGAHPFSITSVWLGNGQLSFLIKALGDYTNTISTKVKVGDHVVI